MLFVPNGGQSPRHPCVVIVETHGCRNSFKSKPPDWIGKVIALSDTSTVRHCFKLLCLAPMFSFSSATTFYVQLLQFLDRLSPIIIGANNYSQFSADFSVSCRPDSINFV